MCLTRKQCMCVGVILASLCVSMAWGAADPNFIAAYWLDDQSSTTVWDDSGNGRNGAMNGDVDWTEAGRINGGLEFSGGTIDISTNVDNLSFGDVDLSVTAWIKTTAVNQAFFSKDPATGNVFAFGVGTYSDANNATAVVTNRNRTNIRSVSDVNTGEWVHLGFTQEFRPADSSEFWSMYVDGVRETTLLTDVLRDDGQEGMYIGRGEEYNEDNFLGTLDELYVYGSVLDEADMPFVMIGMTWKPRARDMMPVDEEILSSTSAALSWSPGWADTVTGAHIATDSHKLYLSTDANAVIEGQETALITTLDVNHYSVSDLIPNATYYWRVDEVNDFEATSPWTGAVQSFTVPDLAAKNPSPADGTRFQALDLNLTWVPGIGATSHVVYLGNNYDAVDNATTGGVTVTEPNYAPAGLQADKVYFWRVDEINGSVVKGDVWMFSTVPVADGDHIDPNLLVWWKLDEGQGDVAVDYSGYGRHGSFVGVSDTQKPLWDIGNFGGAVRFWDSDAQAGLGFIDMPPIPGFDSPEVTIGGWMYLDDVIGSWNALWSVPTRGSGNSSIFVVNGNMRVSWPSEGSYTWVHSWDVDSGLTLPIDEWFWIGVSAKGTDGADYYLNSATYHNSNNFRSLIILDSGGNLGRTKAKAPNQCLRGLADDWRIYANALTAEELQEVMRGEVWLAWAPQPKNGVTADLFASSVLSWSAGEGAVSHNVFLTTDANDLQNADANDTTGVFRGNQAGTSYDHAAVQANTTYYWRIDEVQADGSVRKGLQWSFTAADYLIIEDFESYDDEDATAIWATWMDAYGFPALGLGGSFAGYPQKPYMEKEKVIEGSTQSMPLVYSNDGSDFYDIDEGVSQPTHSEVKLDVPFEDWTTADMANLSVPFRGDASVGAGFTEDGGVYTITGAGHDIWATEDSFYIVYKTLAGDGSLTAKVESVENSDPWSRAGVMIRANLDGGAQHGISAVTPGQGVNFTYRTNADEQSVNANLNDSTAPYWVRITREGSNISAFASADGVTFEPIGGSQFILMDTDVVIGMVVCSHADGGLGLCESVFSDVTFTGTVSGDLQGANVNMLENLPDRFYLTVEDMLGATFTADHPDNPTAVQNGTFSNFVVALADIAAAGLDLTQIKSLTLGTGNVSGPATAKGTLYIDDILLVQAVEEPNEPNVPVLDPFLIADFDTDPNNADDWVNGFGSGGRFTGRSLSNDTPDGSATSMQIEIDYTAGGWGSAWGAFSGTGVGPADGNDASSVDASNYSYFSAYMKSSIDGAALNIWFEHFPGPTQGYVNEVTISGITTEWAYYEVDLSTAVGVRDGLHDMTAVNRMSFGGPADLGAPYTILLDQLKFSQNPDEGMLP